MSRSLPALLAALCAAPLLLSCDDDGSSESCPGDHCVAPGENDQETLQTLLIEVRSGETIYLEEGTFKVTSELSLSVDNVTVLGAGRDKTIIDFTGQDFGAQAISVTGDGAVLQAFTVKNAGGDGVRASDVEGITFRDLAIVWTEAESTDNGPYGLYPIASTDVLIDNCYVKGASDAGIYVGQSRNILVKDSEAEGNVAGIEIENSIDAEVVGCHAHDNTGGILVFNLPELPMQGGARAKIHDNIVENNNLENFGKAGSVVGLVPGGTGMIVLAADENEVTNNTIRGNESTGILVISYQDSIFGEFTDENFDAYAEGNHIHGNTFENNGAAPQGALKDLGLMPPLADILWEGCVREGASGDALRVGMCIHDNGDARFHNFRFCNGLTDQVFDAAEFACTHEPLPAVAL